MGGNGEQIRNPGAPPWPEQRPRCVVLDTSLAPGLESRQGDAWGSLRVDFEMYENFAKYLK